MKKLISLIMCICLITSVFVFADCSASAQGVYEDCFSYEIENNEVAIGHALKDTESIAIPSEIEGYPVTSIVNYAFKNCKSLKNITIPNSVKSIGNDIVYNTAFFNDESNWEDNALYVDDCLLSGRKYSYEIEDDGPNYTVIAPVEANYTIKDGTRLIADRAFYGCDSLASVTLPESVNKVGEMAFFNCVSLTSANMSDNIDVLGELTFANCGKLININIPSTLKAIPKSAFYSCSALESVEIPSNIATICSEAFYNCDAIKEITIPNSVNTIGEKAFYSCSNLSSISLPNSLKSIEKNAFSKTKYYYNQSNWNNNVLYIGDYLVNTSKTGVSATTTVSIKSGTRLIADYAFGDATKTTTVNVPASVEIIGINSIVSSSIKNININKSSKNYSSISGVLFNKDATELICYPYARSSKTYSIPKQVISIGKIAFCGNKYLTKITFTNKVKYIKIQSFKNCSKLSSVSFGSSVKIIGTEAFTNCYNLSTVTIGKNVLSIYDKAFYNCTKLSSVTIGKKVKAIGNYAFCGDKKLLKMVVPKSVSTIGSFAIGFSVYNDSDEYEERYEYSVISNFKLYAKKDSTAMKYAKNNKLKYGYHLYKLVKTYKKATYFSKGKAKFYCYVDCKNETIKTAVRKLKVPAVKLTASSKKITVKYPKVKNATGYQIYILKGSKWKKYTTKSLSYTLSNLKSKQMYSVKVRAKITQSKKSAYSKFSSIKKITTK